MFSEEEMKIVKKALVAFMASVERSLTKAKGDPDLEAYYGRQKNEVYKLLNKEIKYAPSK